MKTLNLIAVIGAGIILLVLVTTTSSKLTSTPGNQTSTPFTQALVGGYLK